MGYFNKILTKEKFRLIFVVLRFKAKCKFKIKMILNNN